MGPQAHRYRGKLPEVRHQPGMGIRRQAAVGPQLATEVFELLARDSPFEERSRIDARRSVPLKVDDVAFLAILAATEEVVVANLVQRRGRRVRGNVSADAIFHAVGSHDHRHGVPANEALDAALDSAAAGIGHFLAGVNGVDIRRVRRERQLHTVLLRVNAKLSKQPTDSRRTPMLQHVVERLEPLPGFNRFQLPSVAWCRVPHSLTDLSF